jgi:hypothetical protein
VKATGARLKELAAAASSALAVGNMTAYFDTRSDGARSSPIYVGDAGSDFVPGVELFDVAVVLPRAAATMPACRTPKTI